MHPYSRDTTGGENENDEASTHMPVDIVHAVAVYGVLRQQEQKRTQKASGIQ